MNLLVIRRLAFAIATASLLAACSTADAPHALSEQPTLAYKTKSVDSLRALPPPESRVYVAVFQYMDQTGQHKPNSNLAEYSSAVTQGGAAILINALREAGNGLWFSVLERQNLNDLLQERQLVRASRAEFPGQDGKPLPPIRALLNAGIILQGGVVGYDTNTLTGGAGANYLGIGGNVEYRQDTVTVALRVVSTLTGEVLSSVLASKTIYSINVQANVFKFVSFNKLLQAEAGFATNEPAMIAVKQAIEKAVRSIILEGAASGYWKFADKEAQDKLVAEYLAEKRGE
jgi:curli production assembly/transport component CsgG